MASIKEKTLFEECIDSLKADITILSKKESSDIFETFENTVPITQGSRIDWDKIDKKIIINSPEQITDALENLLQRPVDKKIYILWNDASVPVVETNLDLALEAIDDVKCVAFETWFFNQTDGYVIEIYYLGEIILGLLPATGLK